MNLSPNKNWFDDAAIVHGMDSRPNFIRLEKFGNFVDWELTIAIVFDQFRNVLGLVHVKEGSTVRGVAAPIQTPITWVPLRRNSLTS